MQTAETEVLDYESQGHITVENMLTPDEVELLRTRIGDIALGKVPFPQADVEFEPTREGDTQPPAARKINRCAENDEVFLACAANPKILDIVEKLIGPDIKLFGSQCFMKPPGGIEKPYHQDSAYFTIEPLSLVTCWIAIDNVTVENGCMWVVPGSHRGELHDHSQPWDLGGRMDMQIPDEKIPRDREQPITLTAGSCSFHHSKLLHRSGPNHTGTPRRGFAVHYMSARSKWTHPTKPQPQYALLRGREFEGCV